MPLDFYLAHGPAGGSDTPLLADNPLGAGDHQVVLEGNARWLAQQNWRRVLASHPGGSGVLQYIALGTHYLHKHPRSGRWPRLHLAGTVWVTPGETVTAQWTVLAGIGPATRLAFIAATTHGAVATVDLQADVTDAWVYQHVELGGEEAAQLSLVSAWLAVGGSNSKAGFSSGWTLYLEEQP